MTVSTEFNQLFLDRTNSNYHDLILMFGIELSVFYFSSLVVYCLVEYRLAMVLGIIFWFTGYCLSFGFFTGNFYAFWLWFAVFAGFGSGIIYW